MFVVDISSNSSTSRALRRAQARIADAAFAENRQLMLG